MTLRTLALPLAVLALVATAGPALAGAGAAPAGNAPLIANYWSGFIEHWMGVFQKQNGIIMTALLVGVICLFIITRGKWKK
jgi:hypothetical protein